MRYKKSDSVVSRKISGEMILVPVRQRIGDLHSIYTLNEVAGRVWELVDGRRTLAQIKNALLKEYRVDSKRLEKDLRDLFKRLESIHAVESV